MAIWKSREAGARSSEEVTGRMNERDYPNIVELRRRQALCPSVIASAPSTLLV
jgi:hypothetical protein